jgi:DNA adenine methylase
MNALPQIDPTVTRPVLRWHGGKWRLAPWIINHFPPHRVYVEPFGGAGSVLLRKERSYAEIYNDLDNDVVNLFRVLRTGGGAQLADLLRLTPFARLEFKEAYDMSPDPVERARRLCIRAMMGFGSNGHNIRVKTGFRNNSNRSNTTPALDWRNYPDTLLAVIDRLQGVVIENREAVACMEQHDGPETLHYLDPPYPHETRSLKNVYDLKYRGSGSSHRSAMYEHELTRKGHIRLLAAAKRLRGMVVISSYGNTLYEDRLRHWRRVETPALADGAQARTEVLWINPAAADALDRAQLPLLSRASA